MKKRTLLDLWNAIARLEEFKSDIKFSYFLAKNKMIIKEDIQLLEEIQKPSVDFSEFESKRVTLLQTYADKDRTGRAQYCSQSNQYILTVNRQQFEEEFAKLRDEYRETLLARERQMKGFTEILNEEIQIKLMKIKLSNLPKEIASVFLNTFMEADLIEEDTSEEENK